MSRVDLTQIKKLGELARLSLGDEECARLRDDLEMILELAEQIQNIDTEGVSPTSHALVEPTFRPDEPRPSLSREALLERAPDASGGDGLFKVPKVLP